LRSLELLRNIQAPASRLHLTGQRTPDSYNPIISSYRELRAGGSKSHRPHWSLRVLIVAMQVLPIGRLPDADKAALRRGSNCLTVRRDRNDINRCRMPGIGKLRTIIDR